jgi:hypothetical protein
MLGIEETILETGSFKKIRPKRNSNTQIRFFNKNQELYPCFVRDYF